LSGGSPEGRDYDRNEAATFQKRKHKQFCIIFDTKGSKIRKNVLPLPVVEEMTMIIFSEANGSI
jgi:hypothetical protein